MTTLWMLTPLILVAYLTFDALSSWRRRDVRWRLSLTTELVLIAATIMHFTGTGSPRFVIAASISTLLLLVAAYQLWRYKQVE